MKKLFLAMILMTAALAVNAQRTPVKVSDLNKAITDNVTRDHPGFAIKSATRVEANKTTKYEVVISKGTTQETLLYDNNGNFIKKIGVKEGITAHKNTSHKKAATQNSKKS